jgi:hypothetical protein
MDVEFLLVRLLRHVARFSRETIIVCKFSVVAFRVLQCSSGPNILIQRFSKEESVVRNPIGKSGAIRERQVNSVQPEFTMLVTWDDYTFDYSFHIDGPLEIVVRASGYLMSSF